MPDTASSSLSASPLLDARGVTKRFGAVVALEDGALTVARGEVVALLGANGCGKSTLCKIVGGSVAPDDGNLRFEDRPWRAGTPSEARSAGIALFYQELSLVPTRTVAENIALGREPRNAIGLVSMEAMRREAARLLALYEGVAGPGLAPDALVGDLSPDQQQIVEICKTIAADARLVILDEATAALDRDQVERTFEILRRLKAEGRGIVFISHRMDEIFAIADRITVMRDGRTVGTVDRAEADRAGLVHMMIGSRLDDAPPRRAADRPAEAPERLTVEGLAARRLAPASFTAPAGEVVGLGGLQGQGQSVLLQALFGAAAGIHGRVLLDGRPLPLSSPARAIAEGVAYISGDRVRTGLFAPRSIYENLVPAVLSAGRSPLVDRPGLLRRFRPIVEGLKLRFAGFDRPVTDLSGGNQQKVVIARWLAARPRLLLLDDPTKGIDLATKADLYRLLGELAAEGAVILFYSSEDAELLDNTDRILVFNSGRIVGDLAGAEKTRFNLTRAAFGESGPAAAAAQAGDP